jgi:hypothetical protein
MLWQIVNKSTVVSPAQALEVATACAMQLREDYAPAHGIFPPTVEFSPDGSVDPKAALVMLIDVAPDEPDALGWHQTTPAGAPIIYVPCKTVIDNGDTVSSVVSHELCEATRDPYCSLWCQTADGKLRAYESCDAVQGDSYTKNVAGKQVPVSNFLLESYFVDTATGAPTDYMGKLHGAIAPARTSGGYDLVIDSVGNVSQEFQDHLASLSPGARAKKTHPFSRTAKRLAHAEKLRAGKP